MAQLAVTVKDATTGAALPYVHVEADGVVLTTGLDGAAIFDVPVGSTRTIKVRNVMFRPWSRSVSISSERVEVTASMEKEIM